MNRQGMAAFGFNVPQRRKTEALAQIRLMAPDISTDLAHQMISRASQYIKEDQPFKVMEVLYNEAEFGHNGEPINSPLDYVGACRVFSYLVTN